MAVTGEQVGMSIFGAVINAFSFAGGSKLFSMFDKNGQEAETKRHNEAMEKMQKDRDEWSKRRQQLVDFANRELAKKNQAIRFFQDEDYYLQLYTQAWNEQHPENKLQDEKEPQLSDYYQPSQEMKNYEYLAISIGVVGTGLVIWYFTK